MQKTKILLVLLYLLTATGTSAETEAEVCARCSCFKKALIQPLYSVDCAHLNLQDAFSDLKHWPDYAQDADTRMAVNLDRNNINHLKKFPAIPGVVSLSFQHNKMIAIEGKAFSELTNLKVLDLSSNQLTAEGVQADVFQGRYSIQSYDPLGIVILNLGNNQIHSLSSHSFEHLPNLTELWLNNNPISILDAPTLVALSSPKALQVLDLSYTGLSDLPDSFVQLPSVRHKLQLLYLNGNKFPNIPETIAALGDSLQKLSLNDNPITELDEDSFRGLLMLRELNISAMSCLERIGPSTFSHLKSLEKLHCSFNPLLTDIDEEAFVSGENQWTLRELHLKSNALHTLPKQLVPWESLAILDVQDNPWRCDCELYWFVYELVPIMEETTPDLVLQLHCSEPLWLSGTSILSLRSSGNSQSLCDNAMRSPLRSSESQWNVIRIVFQAAVIVLAISVTAGLFAFCYLRRRRNLNISFKMFISPPIRYVRTRSDA